MVLRYNLIKNIYYSDYKIVLIDLGFLVEIMYYLLQNCTTFNIILFYSPEDLLYSFDVFNFVNILRIDSRKRMIVND